MNNKTRKRNRRKKTGINKKLNGGGFPSFNKIFNRNKCILQKQKTVDLNQIFNKRFRELDFQYLYNCGMEIYENPKIYNKMIITDNTLSQCKQPNEVINPYLYKKIKRFILSCIQERDYLINWTSKSNGELVTTSDRSLEYNNFLIITIDNIFSIRVVDEDESEDEGEDKDEGFNFTEEVNKKIQEELYSRFGGRKRKYMTRKK